jgi:type IV fimbrial biogenesis protein FimT
MVDSLKSGALRRRHGFTLIELMVVLAIVAVILTIAAPSFRGVIEMKRLRGIQAQIVTDMQYARSEAVSRDTYMRVIFGSSAEMSCYTIYTTTDRTRRCDCTQATPALRCPFPGVLVEARTVQVPTSLGVTVATPANQRAAFAYDNVSGGLVTIPTDQSSAPLPKFVIQAYLDPVRQIDTVLNQAGRPTVCAPVGSTTGDVACPP